MSSVDRNRIKSLGKIVAALCAAASAAVPGAWAVPTPASGSCAYCRALPSSGMRDTIGSTHLANIAALFRDRGGNIAGLFQQRNAVRGGYAASHLIASSPMMGPEGMLAVQGTPVSRFELPSVTPPDLGALFGDSFRSVLREQAEFNQRISDTWYGIQRPPAGVMP